jgi:hypothetical protein
VAPRNARFRWPSVGPSGGEDPGPRTDRIPILTSRDPHYGSRARKAPKCQNGVDIAGPPGFFETLAFCPRTRVRKAPAATGPILESAPALAKIWNGSRYLRVLGDAVKRALMSARRESRSTIPIEVGE